MTDAAPLPADPPLPPGAALLGYLGLLPFVACALGALLLQDLDQADWAGRLLLYYGAVILAFLGAVHWGLVLRGGAAEPQAMLLTGVLPSLAAWVSLALPFRHGLAVQVAAFGLWWLYEHRVVGAAMLTPAWLRLRRNLTVIVCATLALALVGADVPV